ncbi:MAG: hypothetical protein R3F17_14535 [Planctomycetota bacterium]
MKNLLLNADYKSALDTVRAATETIFYITTFILSWWAAARFLFVHRSFKRHTELALGFAPIPAVEAQGASRFEVTVDIRNEGRKSVSYRNILVRVMALIADGDRGGQPHYTEVMEWLNLVTVKDQWLRLPPASSGQLAFLTPVVAAGVTIRVDALIIYDLERIEDSKLKDFEFKEDEYFVSLSRHAVAPLPSDAVRENRMRIETH